MTPRSPKPGVSSTWVISQWKYRPFPGQLSVAVNTEALSDLLQSHAGAHFTFALVELATWRTPGGDILAVPSTLAKTVMIERGIVRVDDGVATVRPVHAVARTGPQSI